MNTWQTLGTEAQKGLDRPRLDEVPTHLTLGKCRGSIWNVLAQSQIYQEAKKQPSWEPTWSVYTFVQDRLPTELREPGGAGDFGDLGGLESERSGQAPRKGKLVH